MQQAVLRKVFNTCFKDWRDNIFRLLKEVISSKNAISCENNLDIKKCCWGK